MKKILLFFAASFLMSCSKNILIVSAETQPCTGLGPMECLLVKNKKSQEKWDYFYSSIEGFNYKKGFEYKLKVKKENLENPPADASSIKYTLVKVLKETKK